MVGPRVFIDEGISDSYRIPTRYIRNIVEMTLDSSVTFPSNASVRGHGEINGCAVTDMSHVDRVTMLAWMSKRQVEVS